MGAHRAPYIGEGEGGARRSADRDLNEADALTAYSPRWDELMESARRWEAQADELMRERIGQRPTLEQVHADVGNEEWLTGLALLKLSSALYAQAASWTTWTGSGERNADWSFEPYAGMDWDAWFADVDERGRGWSSTEWVLFELVASIVDRDRKVVLAKTLPNLGSWETEALRIVVNWASGGNNKDLPGRLTVTPR